MQDLEQESVWILVFWLLGFMSIYNWISCFEEL